MEHEADLKKLERNVERMLRILEAAQEEKSRLQAEVARLSEDKKLLEEQLAKLSDEKKHVHLRVAGLLDSIEKWEKVAKGGYGPDQQSMAAGKAVSEPVQGMLIGN